MTKKLLKQLIQESYKNGQLDEKQVFAIADLLTREELKEYIKFLRAAEKKRTIYIESAKITDDLMLLKDIFPKKRIIFKENPSLLAGIRIINNDDIFNFNVLKNLNDIIEFVEQ